MDALSFLDGLVDSDDEFSVEAYEAERNKSIAEGRKQAHKEKGDAQVAMWEQSVARRYRKYSLRNKEHRDNIMARVGEVGKSQLNDYFDSPTCYLVLRGDNGLGKSIMSVMLARELVRSGQVGTVEMVTGTDLLYQFSTYDPFSRDPGKVDPVAKYTSPDLLILDDVGGDNEKITPSQEQKLSSILDTRYREEKLTIITTNMAVQGSVGRGGGVGLMEYFTPRIWSRISDDFDLISFTGESMRGAR